MEKYKARFVAKAFSQKEAIDYEETFALVAKYSSIQTIISLATKMGWRLGTFIRWTSRFPSSME